VENKVEGCSVIRNDVKLKEERAREMVMADGVQSREVRTR